MNNLPLHRNIFEYGRYSPGRCFEVGILCHVIYIAFAAAIAEYNSYTENVWPFFINDLNCTGVEDSVLDCPHNGLKGYTCNSYHDASVVCNCKQL